VQIAVVGAGDCGRTLARRAREVGEAIARSGAVLLTGGLGGVMEAASRGAAAAGGLVIGVLPGSGDHETPPNEGVRVAIFTGMGQARNQILILSADAVIAVGGGWGTLSEIALALKQGRPVVSLGSWAPERPDGRTEALLWRAADPAEAVARALAAAEGREAPRGS
jgi:uncharacterized protein (TIGR00725 family)